MQMSNNTVIQHALGNDKVDRESIANKWEDLQRNKEFGAGLDEWRGGAAIREREREREREA